MVFRGLIRTGFDDAAVFNHDLSAIQAFADSVVEVHKDVYESLLIFAVGLDFFVIAFVFFLHVPEIFLNLIHALFDLIHGFLDELGISTASWPAVHRVSRRRAIAAVGAKDQIGAAQGPPVSCPGTESLVNCCGPASCHGFLIKVKNGVQIDGSAESCEVVEVLRCGRKLESRHAHVIHFTGFHETNLHVVRGSKDRPRLSKLVAACDQITAHLIFVDHISLGSTDLKTGHERSVLQHALVISPLGTKRSQQCRSFGQLCLGKGAVGPAQFTR